MRITLHWLVSLALVRNLYEISALVKQKQNVINEINPINEAVKTDPTVLTNQPAAETNQSAAETNQPAAETNQPAAETNQPAAETNQPAADVSITNSTNDPEISETDAEKPVEIKIANNGTFLHPQTHQRYYGDINDLNGFCPGLHFPHNKPVPMTIFSYRSRDRSYKNQDRAAVLCLDASGGNKHSILSLAMFDGHGSAGGRVAQRVTVNLRRELENYISNTSRTDDAFKKVLMNLDELLYKKNFSSRSVGFSGGATATIVNLDVAQKNIETIAWGDSGAKAFELDLESGHVEIIDLTTEDSIYSSENRLEVYDRLIQYGYEGFVTESSRFRLKLDGSNVLTPLAQRRVTREQVTNLWTTESNFNTSYIMFLKKGLLTESQPRKCIQREKHRITQMFSVMNDAIYLGRLNLCDEPPKVNSTAYDFVDANDLHAWVFSRHYYQIRPIMIMGQDDPLSSHPPDSMGFALPYSALQMFGTLGDAMFTRPWDPNWRLDPKVKRFRLRKDEKKRTFVMVASDGVWNKMEDFGRISSEGDMNALYQTLFGFKAERPTPPYRLENPIEKLKVLRPILFDELGAMLMDDDTTLEVSE